ncbi:MAG TPA: hypothetical protein DCX79_16990 [Planctomycetaceae bacterium]|jgi:pyruvate/2-oxoglutarate dehydrogenase complex dihydrolipoamide dehydrogenase (E3) component|nr:hypothetical protein [Planctomycetaceae bacterium]
MLQRHLTILGNDQPTLQLSLAAVRSGHPVRCVFPEVRHSAWLIGQALRRLLLRLLADSPASRRTLNSTGGGMPLLRALLRRALADEVIDQRSQLSAAGVTVLFGEAAFRRPGQLTLHSSQRRQPAVIDFTCCVIVSGVRHLLPESDAQRNIMDTERLFQQAHQPPELCVLGGDEVSLGVAALFSLFGSSVELFAEGDLPETMAELAEHAGVRMRARMATAPLSAGIQVPAERTVLDCRRAVGFTEHLNLTSIGVETDDCGRLWCSNRLETWCQHVFGAGAVVGFTAAGFSSVTAQIEAILQQVATSELSRPGRSQSLTR